MAKVTNNFIKGRMNKDLDDRLLPKDEYRNAINAQVSRSEGPNVGALENVLGNILSFDFRELCDNDSLFSIGYCTDEINNRVFLFLTDNTGDAYKISSGSGKTSYIVLYDASTSAGSILVNGDFLNFSTLFPITGVNILEDLLFFTDNRNQPRVINVSLANQNNSSNPLYYTTEDQISVAKYNPYQPIELYRPAFNTATDYETSMYDVVSRYYPDGGEGVTTQQYQSSGTAIRIDRASYQGDLPYGATIAYIKDGEFFETSQTVTSVTGTNNTYFTVNVPTESPTYTIDTGTTVIFNYNPYYEIDYNGDSDYLEELFVRFAYRYKFENGEYSIMSPFTQECFIPKQDGYFRYKVNEESATAYVGTKNNSPILDVQDEEDTYRSTVVEFMENKVNKIILRIPLPATSSNLNKTFKITDIDILYKESGSTNINVIETVSISRIKNGYGRADVNGATTTTTTVAIDNVSGSIKVGALVSGDGVVNNPTVVSYDGGSALVLSTPQSLANNAGLTFGDPNVFEYEYQSTKPYKVLPSSETTRTYDKVPVRALSQEIISNRVVYGNFLDKHTPPSTIDYNVAVSPKSDFNLGTATTTTTALEPQGETVIAINTATGSFANGYTVTSNVVGAVPANTVIASNTGTTITLSAALAGALAAGSTLTFTAPNNVRYTTSKIEYPNHSLKQNRNYQVGVVLSDKFGRQSTVILADGDSSVKFNNESYLGSTVFSKYIASSVEALSFPGNSLKVLFNNPISGGTTGVYNGDPTSADYNPLGWYSYKIVVKQTEQEYYNVYLPGVMAAYPTDPTKELGKTSHAVLFSDNINKVPRDLIEVGPEQKQFRSSVMLHGRVENVNSVDVWQNNAQYYPGAIAPIVSVIATDDDMFNGISQTGYVGSPDFYNVISNPLIARINTPSGKFGVAPVITTADALAATATTPAATLSEINIDISTIDPIYSIGGNPVPGNSIRVGQTITGPGIADGTTIIQALNDNPAWQITLSQPHSGVSVGDTFTFTPTNDSPFLGWVTMPQLAVMETDPVESNLDIFWETSTAGLVTDLNQAVSGGTAEGVSFGFNTDQFDEGINTQVGNNEMCGSDFSILDQFGNTIVYAATNPPQFQLVEVRDFNNNVITSTNEGVSATAVFNLVRDGNNYNVKVQDTFYYSNQHATKDTYSFKFEINHAGIQTFITKQPVSLINLAPVVLASTCGNPPIYVPGTGNGVNTIGTFKVLQATSGAAFGLGVTTPQAWKDLTWRLTVTKSGVDYGPQGTGAVQIVQSQVNNYWSVNCNFTGGDTPNSMVDGQYACVATIEDAGALTATCNFTLDIQRTPCYTWKYTWTDSGNFISLNYTDCEGEPRNIGFYDTNPGGFGNSGNYVCARDTTYTQNSLGTQFTKLALNSTDPFNTCNSGL